MWARFDDLCRGVALVCPPPHHVLVAERPQEVTQVLAEVDRATRAGQWAFGYLAYEAANGLDPRLLTQPAASGGPPVAWFGLCAEPAPAPTIVAGAGSASPGYSARWWPGWTQEDHRRSVERIHERIAAGETYQCNLTVRLRGLFDGDPLALYHELAVNQRGAHNAYLDLDQFVIASASPELFFDLDSERLLLRPMKGTATRGDTPTEDLARADRLRSSAKERAENIMIVDLMRNDAGRIAEPGSVRVNALCRVERYPTVLQLTSDVTARPRPGTDLVALFRALFPCGSITGAPKAATMALIRELESGPRGVYCGAIGLVGPGIARFNVAIRTVVINRATGEASYGTGGGITWSSEPDAEHAEVLAKTAILAAGDRQVELLETMYHHPRQGLRHRDRHLRRMAASAAELGFRFDRDQVIAALRARTAGLGAARVRLRLASHGGISVDIQPPPEPPRRQLVLAVDTEPVHSGWRWLRHKTSLREPYERRARRHPWADDALLVNERGEITEATTANVAVRLDGRWYTPPATSGCLPGVERARLIETGVLTERVIHLSDLRRAQGLALINSLRGWRDATLGRHIDTRPEPPTDRRGPAPQPEVANI